MARKRNPVDEPAVPLPKRQREIANEIKAGGTQLTMMFGGASSSEETETEH